MESISASVRYWLVEHPLVSGFEWIEGETFGSSPKFLLTTVATYLSLTYILSITLLSPKPPVKTPSKTLTILRSISAIHNLILLALSFIMALGATLATTTKMPSKQWICFPANKTRSQGPLFFWAYVFYLSKILEYVDTLLIILHNDARRLTFLHVYHHTVVTIMCYLWLHTTQSLLPLGIVTNATVHTVMYAYYFMCTLGKRPSWKRLVTDFQIIQFWFGLGISTLMLWFHFTGTGCSGIWGWGFSYVFNASLLALFSAFHANNYANKDKDKKLV
uniref:very-long-chain 3-oxoacyl-CoA synthase n=1 Tax=Eranthis hyemalis TaxID=37492 RepID=A0A346RAC0_ERYHA|nr:fatty acid elongase [Eranthis hyemalis]